MHRASKRRLLSLAAPAPLFLVILAGCPGPVTAVGIAIAATTVTFLLDQVGVIDVRASGGPTRTAGVVTLPFAGPPMDRPSSATLSLDVGRTQALPVGSAKRSNQQALNGAASIKVRMASSGSTNPCSEGVELGAFELTITNGVISAMRPSLALPPQALEFAISGSFTICLEATATIDVLIDIPQMDVAFGPDGASVGGSGDDSAPATDSGDDPGAATDPGTDPGPDTDPGTDPTPDPHAGFTLTTPLHVGSEAIIAGPSANAATGFVPPDRFFIHRFAMSGDGRYVWFYLYWDSVTPPPPDRYRLYRIDTAGTLWERSLINEEAEALGGGWLATNVDGSIGVYEMQRCEPAGVFCRPESRFLRLTPSAPAAAFYDTESDAGLPSSSGQRMTDDGQTIFWHETENLWTIGTTGGVAQQLVSVAHLNFYGPWDPFTGGQLFGLDITASGDEWLLGARFNDPQTHQLRWELVQASGALPQNLTGIPKQTSAQLQPWVQISDDGQVVGYEEANAFGVGGAFVQSATDASDLRNNATPSAEGAYGLVVADNGQRVLAEVNFNNQRTPVFHEIATGKRFRAGSSRFPAYARQLSDDGQTCIGFWNSNPIGTPFNNVYVLRDGVEGLPGYPQFGEMRYRYDAEGDALVIRVRVTSSNGLERIYMLPHYHGIEPVGAVPDAQNPLYNERQGGGVNFSTIFTPVEGLADTYERSISLSGKRAYLDGNYTVRIIAVDATGTRTTFRDMALTP